MLLKTIRIFYTKTGTAKFISHLDINRCFQRALKRTGLPFWYTEGFNPHPYVTFALPLSLGYDGLWESMDFRLLEELPAEEIIARFNAVLPAGLRVFRAAEPVCHAEEIRAAAFEIRMAAEGKSAEALAAAWEAFLLSPAIPVEKRTKKGVSTLDLVPCITASAVSRQGDEVLLTLLLPAGNPLNINPSLLIEAFTRQTGTTFAKLAVARVKVYAGDGKIFC